MAHTDDQQGAPLARDETPSPKAAPLGDPAGDGYMGVAAVAIVVAMACLLVGALIGALATDLGTGPDVWKARVRLMSISGSGSDGGVLVALGLLVALGFVRAARQRTILVTAVVGSAMWLGLLMVLNIYVDVTRIAPADISFATVLGDVAALVMVAGAGYWGFGLAGAKRS